eukprot:s3584_g10.t2
MLGFGLGKSWTAIAMTTRALRSSRLSVVFALLAAFWAVQAFVAPQPPRTGAETTRSIAANVKPAVEPQAEQGDSIGATVVGVWAIAGISAMARTRLRAEAKDTEPETEQKKPFNVWEPDTYGNISMDDVKKYGTAGTLSYVITELLFWAIAFPTECIVYLNTAGHWPDFSKPEESAAVFGLVFAASNIARLLLPLRFGAALAMAPWVDENIMQKFFKKEECPNPHGAGQGGRLSEPLKTFALGMLWQGPQPLRPVFHHPRPEEIGNRSDKDHEASGDFGTWTEAAEFEFGLGARKNPTDVAETALDTAGIRQDTQLNLHCSMNEDEVESRPELDQQALDLSAGRFSESGPERFRRLKVLLLSGAPLATEDLAKAGGGSFQKKRSLRL